jgi:N-ethylmaleimide reductase
MKTSTLFTSHHLGNLPLANRIVMAPMTRSRAINNLPNELIATYYRQRAEAGLIVTEGTSPSPNGLGYSRIPGIFSTEQVKAWKQVTDAVHEKDGKIFVQLMHTGRISHEYNLPKRAKVLAPSAIAAKGKMWTDEHGMQDLPVPQALSLQEVESTKQEFVQAAIHAIDAGFDGIEFHAANGYLLEQFLSPHSNQRTDNYGGSVENRARFILEIAEAVNHAIGKGKAGIRFSPYSTYNDMPHYDEIDETYTYLAEKLNEIGLVYLHLVDNAADSTPLISSELQNAIREKFKNTIIHTGGNDLTKGERLVSGGLIDLVGIGRPFISNPDLVYRLKKNLPLNIKLDASTFFSAGAKGYTDYPVFEEEIVSA